MKIDTNEFRVREGNEVDLKKWPTNVKPVYKSEKHYKKLLENHVAQLSAMQHLHYASDHYAVLLIFQAMDAAGKDGAIRHVMSGVIRTRPRPDTAERVIPLGRSTRITVDLAMEYVRKF